MIVVGVLQNLNKLWEGTGEVKISQDPKRKDAHVPRSTKAARCRLEKRHRSNRPRQLGRAPLSSLTCIFPQGIVARNLGRVYDDLMVSTSGVRQPLIRARRESSNRVARWACRRDRPLMCHSLLCRVGRPAGTPAR